VIEAALSSPFAIPRKTLMLRKMDELCYSPSAEAKAIPTGTVKLRLARARQPLEPARTEVRLVKAGPGKRNGALVRRRFAIRHHLRRVLR
jgi:DNA-directed RNA polymerase specialized sigma24 family protein